MRQMFDSTNPLDIPNNAEAVAGYLDLWPAGAWDRFTNASVKRYIARNVNEDGDTADVETGDLTPAQAPDWCKRRIAAGVFRPWCYCNLSTKAALFAAMAGAGLVLHQDWEWWSAGYFDGSPRLDPDAIATQYADPATSGGHYDLSLISDAYAGGFLLALTDQQQQEMYDVLHNLGGAVAPGQDDVAGTIVATLTKTEGLVNDVAALSAKVDALSAGSGGPHAHVTGPPVAVPAP